jgi:SAM-dependent methyltransferase
MSFYAIKKWEAPDRNFPGHRDIFTVNMSRYKFAAKDAYGRCLDIGCGRGYGLGLLEESCRECTGLDMSDAFICEAQENYPEHTFVCQGAESLSFSNGAFDTIVSFEVIEHVEDDHAFLNEIRRVAAKGAHIVLSTPNRLVASPGRDTPHNKFHVREYIAAEFEALLRKSFDSVEVFGQIDVSMLGAEEGRSTLMSRMVDRIPVGAKYLIPHYIQDLLGVMVRPAVKIEDCLFRKENIDQAHTLLAVCSG